MASGVLQDLESQLAKCFGCRNHYRLQVWRQCRSFNFASVDDRIRIAEEILASEWRGGVVWGWGGRLMLIKELRERLIDPNPEIQTEAMAALVALGENPEPSPHLDLG